MQQYMARLCKWSPRDRPRTI